MIVRLHASKALVCWPRQVAPGDLVPVQCWMPSTLNLPSILQD